MKLASDYTDGAASPFHGDELSELAFGMLELVPLWRDSNSCKLFGERKLPCVM